MAASPCSMPPICSGLVEQSAPSDRLDLGGLRRFLSQVGRDRAGGGDIRRIYWVRTQGDAAA
jgi:hypothetical protein